MSGGQEVFSYSRLNTFDACRYRYKLQYIDKLRPGPTTVEAFMGSRVHDALEDWYGRRALGESVGLHDLIQAYREAWQREWRSDVRVVRRNSTPEHYRSAGERCLINYYQATGRSDCTETLAMEMRVEIPLGDEGSPAMQGYIDRLARAEDGALEIHDYKTTARLPTAGQVEGDHQLALYQMGLERMFPGAPSVRQVRHYLSFGQQHRSQAAPEQLIQIRERTKAKIGAIRACVEFPPNVTPLCGWCAYQDRCEAWKGSSEP